MSLYQESPRIIRFGIRETPNPYTFGIPTVDEAYPFNFEIHSGGHNGTVLFDNKGQLR